MNITLETVTPVHIGNGEEWSFLDYFIENGKANILNTDAIFESLNDVQIIDNLSKEIEEKIINGQAQINPKEFFGNYIDVSKYIIKRIESDEISGKVKIKKFINQQGRYYIPGSSIKGAIRTAYFFDFFDKKIDTLVDVLKNKNDKFKELNQIVFGEITSDFFKYFHVTDSQFISDSNMKIIKTIRYNNEKNKEGVPICLEAIKEHSIVNFEIKIDDRSKITIEDIKNSVRNLTTTVCDYETNNNKNPDFIKNFYNEIKKNNEIYLNLGFGGGYLVKTIYLLLWKHKKDISLIKNMLPIKKKQKVDAFYDFPRTKVIYNKKPIGWVKILR